MALVNLIRINARAGALIADEEFWRRGYRRTLSLDNLQPILPESFCESTGMEVVLGFDGDPSITYEATLRVKRRLAEIVDSAGETSSGGILQSVKDVTDVAVEEIEKLIRKRINDQLGFAYGFSVDDLNRGYFEHNGQRIEIKQETIRTEAMQWTRGSEKARTRPLSNICAVIAGVDAKSGFHWYEWIGRPGNIFLGTGHFESMGKGSDAANLAFIDFFRKRELKKRREGMSTGDALFALIQTLEAAARFNHEVGGYPQFVIIDGDGKTHKERYREYSGHGARLAQEIVTASVHGYVNRKDAISLMQELILEDGDYQVVEEKFFAAAGNSRTLDHFLRGYKSAVAGPEKEIRS